MVHVQIKQVHHNDIFSIRGDEDIVIGLTGYMDDYYPYEGDSDDEDSGVGWFSCDFYPDIISEGIQNLNHDVNHGGNGALFLSFAAIRVKQIPE